MATVRENNNTRRRAKTESEAGHFMDSKENKLHYLIQLELLRHMTSFEARKNVMQISWLHIQCAAS